MSVAPSGGDGVRDDAPAGAAAEATHVESRDDVEHAVADAFDAHVAPDAVVAVAVSGGRDSMALLVAAHRVARRRCIAIHVDHGLSAYAGEWARFCALQATALGIPLETGRVEVANAGELGTEAAARKARYAMLRARARALGAQCVLLAHHQDDQAETLLLQLARGAGPQGLAGMPVSRVDASGMQWLRPLLGIRRRAIEAYVAARDIAYIDDDSNASRKHRRNAMRQSVVPALAATFPGYPATFARAAMHQAEAAQLANDLAAIDARSLVGDGTLDRAGFAALAPHRARNLLRHFLRSHGLQAPSLARLSTMVAQLSGARSDARVRLAHQGAEIGIHRGRVVVHAPPPPPYERRWQGEDTLLLAHGRLQFTRVPGEGLDCATISSRNVLVRARRGGERIQLAKDRPRRALKAVLQEAGMAPWERQMLPLVWCDGELAAVPGIGVDVAFAAAPGAAGLRIEWQRGR